jgi:beta-phosphoglucomutase-like phosphatase (HAD superfamily)
MNLQAEDCVVFEDAVYAMRGAKAAGCARVWPSRMRPRSRI